MSLNSMSSHNVVTGNLPFFKIYVKFNGHDILHATKHNLHTCLLLEMFYIFYKGLRMNLSFVCYG